ncbi:MAG: RNA methyltransferase [Lachnospiraceae bacterium]|nr:RNA methyltransferase [Lachnospiraceae bacterium]
MITSNSNPQVKNIIQLVKKAKARNEQRLFVVEGVKMFAEAPKEWIRQVYVSESFETKKEHKELLAHVSCEVVSDSVFKTMSDTQTPQGILALLQQPSYGVEDLLNQPAHLLVLEDIQDPGNLGTMFRTGEGAGISGIIMSRGTVDVFNPKVVRSTMGSIFRVPFFVAEDLKGIIEELKRRDVKHYAAHLLGSCSYDEPDYTGATAFLIGNEGNGLSDDIASLADCRIRIPMAGQVESLNAAIAATLLMYEAARQRR